MSIRRYINYNYTCRVIISQGMVSNIIIIQYIVYNRVRSININDISINYIISAQSYGQLGWLLSLLIRLKIDCSTSLTLNKSRQRNDELGYYE